MAAVLGALLVGLLGGLSLRPLLDAYLGWKTVRLYAERDRHQDRLFDESAFEERES